jgi:hypothetical protein
MSFASSGSSDMDGMRPAGARLRRISQKLGERGGGPFSREITVRVRRFDLGHDIGQCRRGTKNLERRLVGAVADNAAQGVVELAAVINISGGIRWRQDIGCQAREEMGQGFRRRGVLRRISEDARHPTARLYLLRVRNPARDPLRGCPKADRAQERSLPLEHHLRRVFPGIVATQTVQFSEQHPAPESALGRGGVFLPESRHRDGFDRDCLGDKALPPEPLPFPQRPQATWLRAIPRVDDGDGNRLWGRLSQGLHTPCSSPALVSSASLELPDMTVMRAVPPLAWVPKR